jgi:hypothetical protein
MVGRVEAGQRGFGWAGHQLAQPLAGPRQPRHHGAHGHAEDRGGFLVGQLLDADQQQHLARGRRELRQRALQVQPGLPQRIGLVAGVVQRLVVDLVQVRAQRAQLVEVEVVHQRQQPGAQRAGRVARGRPAAGLAGGPLQRVLHQVVGPPGVAAQQPRVAAQARQVRQGVVEQGHREGRVSVVRAQGRATCQTLLTSSPVLSPGFMSLTQ